MTEQVMPTPGPWHFDEDWRRLPTIFGPDRKTKIATVEKLHGDQRTPQQEANARLIAAAPCMYEALKAVENATSDELNDGASPVWAQIAAAIREADGPQSMEPSNG